MFHESAIFVLLIAFAAVGKPFNLKIVTLLVAFVVFAIMPSSVSGIMKEVMIESKYNFYFDFVNGMGVPRFLVVAIVPLVLGIIYWVKQKKQMDRTEAILFNLMIINSLLYGMGLYMEFWARLAFYTFFAPILLIPKLINNAFLKKEHKSVHFIAIGCYLFFFVFNIYVNNVYGLIDVFYIEWF